MPLTILSLGANTRGPLGEPMDTLNHAFQQLARHAKRNPYAGAEIKSSAVWQSAPVGNGTMKRFYNVIISAHFEIPLFQIEKLSKRIEWEAGRRPGPRWSDRPLDIDIIAHGHTVVGWPPARRQWRRLTVPHARAHQRVFVLKPLAELCPGWRHPVFAATAAQLLRRMPTCDIADQGIEPAGRLCDIPSQ